MIIIIIGLCLLFTIKIYTTFQDLFIIINIYVSKDDYAIIPKHSKKNKKREL